MQNEEENGAAALAMARIPEIHASKRINRTRPARNDPRGGEKDPTGGPDQSSWNVEPNVKQIRGYAITRGWVEDTKRRYSAEEFGLVPLSPPINVSQVSPDQSGSGSELDFGSVPRGGCGVPGRLSGGLRQGGQEKD